MLQPQIILLREGTDTSQGKPQLVSNINACMAVVDVVRTTLGPRGMDKLIHEESGKVTISNDGATIMKLLQIVHPAACTLVDIARSQDAEVGDGTTSVVLLAGEMLRECKPYVEDGVHPQTIIKAIRTACDMAVAKMEEIAVRLTDKNEAEKRDMLEKSAATSLSSKLVSGHKDFFAKMVVDAVLHLDDQLDLNMIGMKQVQGGSLLDSMLVEGVAFKKTFSYAGFEQQTKMFTNPKILMLNIELELKAEKENAEVRVSNPQAYQEIVDAEWRIIYEKLERCVSSGAQIILSKLAIGDLATQYFADRGLFCAGRVPDIDLQRVAKACGGAIQTSSNDLTADCVLGLCGKFEEVQVGADRYNMFLDCPAARTSTIILRGGAEQFIAEAERSLHDAIMNTRRLCKYPAVVAGGGAIELELSQYLVSHARTIFGKQQMLINSYARALEVIPRTVAENAGLDSTDLVVQLRAKHAKGGMWWGIDIVNNGICDTMESFVWEALVMKKNAIQAASEACCLILSVDETIRNPASEKPQGPILGMGGKGRGRGGGKGRGRGR